MPQQLPACVRYKDPKGAKLHRASVANPELFRRACGCDPIACTGSAACPSEVLEFCNHPVVIVVHGKGIALCPNTKQFEHVALQRLCVRTLLASLGHNHRPTSSPSCSPHSGRAVLPVSAKFVPDFFHRFHLLIDLSGQA